MEAPSNNQILSDLRMEGTPWKTRRGPGPACESGMHLKFRWFRPKLWSQYKWKIRTNLITKKEYMRNADRPCWLALACSRSLEKGSALWITSLTWLFLSFFEHSLRKRINFRTSTSEDFTGRPAAFIEADGDYGSSGRRGTQGYQKYLLNTFNHIGEICWKHCSRESNVMSVTWWKYLPTIRSCPISAWKELLGKLAEVRGLLVSQVCIWNFDGFGPNCEASTNGR